MRLETSPGERGPGSGRRGDCRFGGAPDGPSPRLTPGPCHAFAEVPLEERLSRAGCPDADLRPACQLARGPSSHSGSGFPAGPIATPGLGRWVLGLHGGRREGSFGDRAVLRQHGKMSVAIRLGRVCPSVRPSVLLHSVRCVPRPKPRKAVLLCDAVTFTGAHFVRSPCSLIVRDLVSDWPPPPLCPHASPGGSLCPRQVAGPAAGRAHVAAAAAPGTCASAGALLC